MRSPGRLLKAFCGDRPLAQNAIFKQVVIVTGSQHFLDAIEQRGLGLKRQIFSFRTYLLNDKICFVKIHPQYLVQFMRQTHQIIEKQAER